MQYFNTSLPVCTKNMATITFVCVRQSKHKSKIMTFFLSSMLFHKVQGHLVYKTNWVCLDWIRYNNCILLKNSLV